MGIHEDQFVYARLGDLIKADIERDPRPETLHRTDYVALKMASLRDIFWLLGQGHGHHCLRCEVAEPTGQLSAAGAFCFNCQDEIVRTVSKARLAARHMPTIDFNGETLDIECAFEATAPLDWQWQTNVAQHTIFRSSGLTWGYEGDGPTEFAYNIIALFVGNERVVQFYRQFKKDFVAPLDHAGGTIHGIAIVAWLRVNGA